MTSKSFQEIERATYSEAIEGRNVHDNLKDKTIDELRAVVDADRFPFQVMCLSLTGDLNIGSIIRSSILHGAEKVWIYGRKKYDKRGTVGSHNYIEVESVFGFENDDYDFDANKFDQLCVDNKLLPFFIEQGGTELQDFDWQENIEYIANLGWTPLLVFGNETNGIPASFMKDASLIISVPQRGVIRSFNVSSTMAMVTWDMRRDMGWF